MLVLQVGFTTEGVLGILNDLGPLAQGVLVVLGGFSILSWAVIVDRMWLLRKAERQGGRFVEAFHASAKFSEVRRAAQELAATPLAGVFLAGYQEISSQLEAARHRGEGTPAPAIDLETVERSLRKAAHEQRQALERGMLFLATTSSACPFIGLFGTVWGIMSSFHNIAQYGNANLAIVAPGISEALVTTAAGLAAAIPAVIAYNHLLARVRRLTGAMEDFGLEFLNIVQKTWQGAPR